MTATSDALPHLPFPRPGILDIAPLYRTLQATAPITPVRTPAGDVAWLVTSYAEVKALLADPGSVARIPNLTALPGSPSPRFSGVRPAMPPLRLPITR